MGQFVISESERGRARKGIQTGAGERASIAWRSGTFSYAPTGQ